MFRTGRVYRHNSCLDIDMSVDKVLYKDTQRTKLKVRYVAQRNWNFHFWPSAVRVEIKKEDYLKWKDVTFGVDS